MGLFAAASVPVMILWVAGLRAPAAALACLFASHALWRHHLAASKREAEAERMVAEERAVAADNRRVIAMLRAGRRRRIAESVSQDVDPAKAAKAISRMMSGRRR